MRLIATINEALQAGRPVNRMCVTLAAWMRFVARQAKNGVAIVDPDADKLASTGRACTGDAAHDVQLFVDLDTVIPPSLAAEPTFRAALEAAYVALADQKPGSPISV